jgi:hypothetical protein
MWEFSWIERRWPGAGFEDWDRALGELSERGYDAVRIDPFPHLLATDPQKTWTLWPEWNTQEWGAPDVTRIVLLPTLTQFISKCRARGIKVGLSTWYRKDEDDTRMKKRTGGRYCVGWSRRLPEPATRNLQTRTLVGSLTGDFQENILQLVVKNRSERHYRYEEFSWRQGRPDLGACPINIIVKCWTDISSYYSSLLQLCLR